MWQEIIAGIIVAAAVFYLGRRVFKTAAKGEGGECADCPPSELKRQNQK
jgi:hypothetical protein